MTNVSASPLVESPRVAPRARPAKGTTPAAAAAARLYEEYYDRIFGYCLYKLGTRHEAEDAAQTTFLWALRGLDSGIEPRLEANWLFTIAQNACRARIRTRGRRRSQEVLSDPEILESVTPGRPAAGEELVGLQDALRDMPELQRRAILLREWRGLSYKEIAEALGLSNAAVETLIFRARRSLASRLEHPEAHRPRKRAAFAFDVASIASALKSLLAAAGGAKAAALASTAAAVAISIGVPSDTSVRGPVLPRSAKATEQAPASARTTADEGRPSPAVDRKSKPAAPASRPPGKAATPAEPSAQALPPVDEPADELVPGVPQVVVVTPVVEDDVATTTQTARRLADDVADAVPPAVSLPPAPLP
jgi:RNA polymerase sigma-70 factor (ECF subfamily)